MKKKINLDDLIKNKKRKKEKTDNKKNKKNNKIADKKIKNKSIKIEREHSKNNERVVINNIIDEKKDKKDKNEIKEYVGFRIDDEEYGIDGDYVRQIMKFKKPLDLGIKSDIIIGLINTKEGIIPIINLRERFGLKKEIKKNGSIIIMNFGSLRIGIYVDYLIGIVRLERENIKDIPDFLPPEKMRYIDGIGLKKDKKIIIILNHKKLLNEQDIMELKALPEKYQ